MTRHGPMRRCSAKSYSDVWGLLIALAGQVDSQGLPRSKHLFFLFLTLSVEAG